MLQFKKALNSSSLLPQIALESGSSSHALKVCSLLEGSLDLHYGERVAPRQEGSRLLDGGHKVRYCLKMKPLSMCPLMRLKSHFFMDFQEQWTFF